MAPVKLCVAGLGGGSTHLAMIFAVGLKRLRTMRLCD